MTTIEIGFVVLFVAAFMVFMVTLLTVSWVVERDLPKVPTKQIQPAKWPGEGKRNEDSLRHAS